MIIKFIDEEKMSPVQLALESASYVFTQLHGATINYPSSEYSYVFDNTEIQKRIDEALHSIGIRRKCTVPQTDT